MAQSLTVSVQGMFISQEHKSGVSPAEGNRPAEPYSYDVAHILVGTESIHARIDEGFRMADLPEPGEVFVAELKLSAYRNQGNAELAARLVGRLPLAPLK